MGFVASLGITIEILACTLPKGQSSFWPLLVTIFYILLPIPIIISKRIANSTTIEVSGGRQSITRDYALFATAGIIVSSIALPIIMARSPIDKPAIAPISCFLTEMGNLLCYATMALYCLYFKPLDYRGDF